MREGDLELRLALERRPGRGVTGLVGGRPQREVALVVVVRVRREHRHFLGDRAGVGHLHVVGDGLAGVDLVAEPAAAARDPFRIDRGDADAHGVVGARRRGADGDPAHRENEDRQQPTESAQSGRRSHIATFGFSKRRLIAGARPGNEQKANGPCSVPCQRSGSSVPWPARRSGSPQPQSSRCTGWSAAGVSKRLLVACDGAGPIYRGRSSGHLGRPLDLTRQGHLEISVRVSVEVYVPAGFAAGAVKTRSALNTLTPEKEPAARDANVQG